MEDLQSQEYQVSPPHNNMGDFLINVQRFSQKERR